MFYIVLLFFFLDNLYNNMNNLDYEFWIFSIYRKNSGSVFFYNDYISLQFTYISKTPKLDLFKNYQNIEETVTVIVVATIL